MNPALLPLLLPALARGLAIAAVLQGAPPPATHPPAGGPQVASAPASRTIVGEIQLVDTGRRQITLVESIKSTRGEKVRESVTVSVDARTQLIRGNEPTTLEEIRPKDQAVVRYLVTSTGARAVSVRVAALAVPPTRPPAAPTAQPGS